MSKYIDLDSTYRNRNSYLNPNDYVVPIYLYQSGSSYLDAILLSAPFTGSTKPIADNVTQFSADGFNIALDASEPDIINFYRGDNLQIGGEFHEILSYDPDTKIAVVETGFSSVPFVGTHYTTRKTGSYFSTNVMLPSTTDNTGLITSLNILNRSPSLVPNFYSQSYFTFDNGPLQGKIALISNYNPQNTNLAWVQPVSFNSSSLVSTTTEFGFVFSPSITGFFKSISLNLTSFETSSPNRTLLIRIRQGYGTTGSILFSSSVSVSNISNPTDTTFTFSSSLIISVYGEYTLTIIDTTPNGINTGFVYIYGIQQNIPYNSFNTSTYPRFYINSLPIPGGNVWVQPIVNGSTNYIPTQSEVGFEFSLNGGNGFDNTSIYAGDYALTTSVLNNEFQGYSVDISNDGLVYAWGSPTDNGGIGCVWVFSNNSIFKIVPTTNNGNCAFGTSVSLSGDGSILAIGGPNNNSNRGAVWIYIQSNGIWTSQTPSPLTNGGLPGLPQALQGYSVALSYNGLTLAVGAPNANIYSLSQSGCIIIYKYIASNWSVTQTLSMNNYIGDSHLGYSVSMSNDASVVVGGGYNDNSGIGAIWIFTFSGFYTGQKIVPTDNSGASNFGYSVDIDDNQTTIAIGGPLDTAHNGAVWIYNYNSGWAEVQKITVTDALNYQEGIRVKLNGSGIYLVYSDSGYNSNTGIIRYFSKTGGIWTQLSNIPAYVNTSPAKFGSSIGFDSVGQKLLSGNINDFSNTYYINPTIESQYISVLEDSSNLVYLSNDFGSTFNSSTVSVGSALGISISGNGQSIVVIDDTTVYISNDFGVTYPTTNILGTNLKAVYISYNGQYQTVIGSDAVYVSDDFGVSWTTITSVTGFDIYMSSSGQYQISCNSNNLYLSIDFGVSWNPITISLPIFGYIQYGNKLVGTGYTGTPTQGYSIAISGDGLIQAVGSVNNNGGIGTVFMYSRSGSTWTQDAMIVPADRSGPSSAIGNSVSLSNDGTVLIFGGPNDGAGGAIWFYTRSGSVWTENSKKTISGTTSFGTRVCMSDDGKTATVSDPFYDVGGASGSFWVYTESGGVWSLQGGRLVGTGLTGTNNDFQGTGLALSRDGDTIVTSGADITNGTIDCYIFTRSAGVWSQNTSFSFSSTISLVDNNIGSDLNSDGTTFAITNASTSINIYIYSLGAWSLQQTIQPDDSSPSSQSYFGSTVALTSTGNNVCFGSSRDSSNLGAGWIFSRSGVSWSQLGAKFVGDNYTGSTIYEGFSIDISSDGTVLVMGGYRDDSNIGASWTFIPGNNITSNCISNNGQVISFGLSPINSGGNTAKIYTSLDGGTTFGNIYDTTESDDQLTSISMSVDGQYILCSASSISLADKTYIGYKSSNFGSSFSQIGAGTNKSQPIGGSSITSSGKYSYLSGGNTTGGTNSGLYSNSTYSTVFSRNSSLSTFQIYSGTRSISSNNGILKGNIQQGSVSLLISNYLPSATLTDLNLSLTSYESVLANRSVLLNLRQGYGLSGTIIYSTTLTVSNIVNATFTNFPINTIITPGEYTLSFQDITNNGINTGFVDLYGIVSDNNFVVLNSTTYPKLSLIGDTSFQTGATLYSQPTNSVVATILSGTEKGFKFTPTTSGYLIGITLNLTSFGNRNITFNLYNGAGLGGGLLYTTTLTILNTPVTDGGGNTDYTCTLPLPVTVVGGNVYTFSLIDNNSGRGVYIYGISTNATYVSYNTSVYPKSILYVSNITSVWSQIDNPTISTLMSTTIEYGYAIFPVVTGFPYYFNLLVTSFDTSKIRTIRINLYEGEGLGGTLLSTNNINISNIQNRNYIQLTFDPLSVPNVTQNSPYTISVEDITGTGTTTGSIRIFGITSDSTYVSYNTSVYGGLRVVIPTYTISFSPGFSPDNFIGNGSDIISLSIASFENATALFHTGSMNRKLIMR